MKSKKGLVFFGILLGSLAVAGKSKFKPDFIVYPNAETMPVDRFDDSMDDIAVWIHPNSPEKSVIIGTEKEEGGGLWVYNLRGEALSVKRDGSTNNVDLRQGNMFGLNQTQLIAASNRKDNGLALYQLNPKDWQLTLVSERVIPSRIKVYGICMYHDLRKGEVYAFLTGKEGAVEKWKIFRNHRVFSAEPVEVYQLDSKIEGCVADDQTGRLFVGEEEKGIWSFNARDLSQSPILVDEVGNGHLTADVEGLAIYRPTQNKNQRNEGFLIASSQGSHSYAIYELASSHRYIASFRIDKKGPFDRVSKTDGIEAVSVPLGKRFPRGVFIAQDDQNLHPSGAKFGQNFKLVSFTQILEGLSSL